MPISLARVAEGQGPAATLRYYAGLAEAMPAEERRPANQPGRVTVGRCGPGRDRPWTLVGEPAQQRADLLPQQSHPRARTRYDEVVDAVADLARSLRVGDPLDPATRVGPLVTQQQRERVEGFITAGRAEGARVVAGGGRPKDLDRGWYIEPPSLLTWPRTPPPSGGRSSGPCSLSSRTTTSTTR